MSDNPRMLPRRLGRLVVAVLVAWIAACASHSPDEAGWQLLGSRQVSNLVDFEVIAVSPPRKLRAVKLLVLGSPVRIHGIRVELSSGEHLEASLASTTPAGDEGPIIEIPEGETVERVVFRHDTGALFDTPASVALYGRE